MKPLTCARQVALAVLLSGICASCSWLPARNSKQDVVVRSMIALIANPDLYHGRRVRTEGIATIGFEEDAIFLSAEDARDGVLLNSIGLSLHDAPLTEAEKAALNNRRILVEGTFSRYENDHLRGQISNLTIVSRVDLDEREKDRPR